MEIEVTIPGLLADCVGGRTTFSLAAETLSEALGRMREEYPLLRIHLYDEQEVLRPHVVIFYNEGSIAWLPSLDVPLRPGDRIHVLQAVSGG
jgi:molybdopterin converting factor small subunit